jgi:hypothetical protein
LTALSEIYYHIDFPAEQLPSVIQTDKKCLLLQKR